MQVYSLISNISSDFLPPGHWSPVHSCAISTPRRAYSPAAISAYQTYHTHCHLCPTIYCTHFHLSQVKHLRVKCFAQGHNIETMSPYWEGRNITFLWKSCTKGDSKAHGLQRHRQSSALTIAPCPVSRVHWVIVFLCFSYIGPISLDCFLQWVGNGDKLANYQKRWLWSTSYWASCINNTLLLPLY